MITNQPIKFEHVFGCGLIRMNFGARPLFKPHSREKKTSTDDKSRRPAL